LENLNSHSVFEFKGKNKIYRSYLVIHGDYPLSLIPFQSDTKEGQHIVNLTPLSYVPGAKIEKYLGSLNFFLIRETSSLREVSAATASTMTLSPNDA
jgi:hypothetical protein